MGSIDLKKVDMGRHVGIAFRSSEYFGGRFFLL